MKNLSTEKERDRLARQEYRKTKQEIMLTDELFILDIMREGMRQNDPRLR